MPERKEVVILGAGVAGLSAAVDLARVGHGVTLIEKANFAGGHAVRFSCKAAEECVKCGACLVEDKLALAAGHPNIRIRTGTRLERVESLGRFAVHVRKAPDFIDPEKCTGCGVCVPACPEHAICRGTSAYHVPFFALDENKCPSIGDGGCTRCRDACPEGAIRMDAGESRESLEADAIIVATGFHPFHPVNKPYGYGRFPNVITNLELEFMLRDKGRALRRPDGAPPDRSAFIQCVGSRDAGLNHGWCSRVCCASALRMARRIKMDRPETEITVFYIDIQTFGTDFDTYYRQIREDLRFIRCIPGDIYPEPDDRLKLNFYDAGAQVEVECVFDMVVLSVGMEPGPDNGQLADVLNLQVEDAGFFGPARDVADTGIFIAGAAHGPMSIMEASASGGDAAWKTAAWLQQKAQAGIPHNKNVL